MFPGLPYYIKNTHLHVLPSTHANLLKSGVVEIQMWFASAAHAYGSTYGNMVYIKGGKSGHCKTFKAAKKNAHCNRESRLFKVSGVRLMSYFMMVPERFPRSEVACFTHLMVWRKPFAFPNSRFADSVHLIRFNTFLWRRIINYIRYDGFQSRHNHYTRYFR